MIALFGNQTHASYAADGSIPVIILLGLLTSALAAQWVMLTTYGYICGNVTAMVVALGDLAFAGSFVGLVVAESNRRGYICVRYRGSYSCNMAWACLFGTLAAAMVFVVSSFAGVKVGGQIRVCGGDNAYGFWRFRRGRYGR